MTEDTLFRIREIAAAHLALPIAEVRPNTNLRDAGLDSLEIAGLAFELETEFGVLLDDDAVEEIRTVADAVRVVERELA